MEAIVQKQNRPRRFFQARRRRGPPTERRQPEVRSGGPSAPREITSQGDRLRIIPLGGCEEVGRNMVVFEWVPARGERDIVIVDLGLQFPEEDMPGVDYVIPNISYLKGKEKFIRGVIITHGHYDHIGAIPHLSPLLGNPVIYGTKLTLGIIRKRQEDFLHLGKLRLQPVEFQTVLRLGSAFRVSFFSVAHNIPDSVGVVLETPLGAIMHTGDFKMDEKPPGQAPMEMEKIRQWGARGILALLADSTSVPIPGRQLIEEVIQGNIFDILAAAEGRLIIGTFASLLGRIQQIILACEKLGKKVVVEGYSMKRNIEVAHELGYLKVNTKTFIKASELSKYPKSKVVILCTGAQGEERAVLMRLANREHRTLRVEPGDTVIFSSSVVPGNERSVQRLKDGLYRVGAEVIHYQLLDIHAGGHCKQEDAKDFISMVRPRYFVPIYGNHSFLKIHGKLAREVGIPEDKIFVPDNGQVLEFTSKGGKLTDERVPSSYVFVDGLGVGDVEEVVLRDRKTLAAEGIILVIATVDGKTGKLMQKPDIITRGFILIRENKRFLEAIRDKATKILRDHDPKIAPMESYLREKVRNDIGQFIYTKTERRPMILPVVIEV